MELGNHTYSHLSLNDVSADAYIADIIRGEPVTKALLRKHHEHMRYFRAPYLETGKTSAIKTKVADWLSAHGYRMAPVTIDPDDWEFAEPYDDAIARRDRARQRHIRSEYLSFTAKRIAWAKASARLLFGRDIWHIMLLHCTRLNADTLDDILKLLRAAHLRPVSLTTALQDPVYKLPDTYVGKDGIDWLERWADARGVDLPEAGSEDPPADIQAAYDRVDNDRR
jgi:peptidoglycan/xylan/chitin deacetylase (PgdA/CDA1 family)